MLPEALQAGLKMLGVPLVLVVQKVVQKEEVGA